MKNIVDMSKHFSFGALVKFTLPSIAMMIFTSIYGIVDGLFVSNFAGKTAFAAVNFIMPIIMILSPVGFMIGTGGSAIVAKTRGEGDDELANRYFSMLIYAAFVLGFVLMVIGIAAIEPIAQAMGARGDMLSDCGLYGRIILISLPFFVLQYAFQSFFVTAGKPTLGFVVTLVAGCANIVLDALFVGLFGLGIVGAAVATNVSELLGGAIPLFYFFRKNGSYLRLVRTKFEWDVFGKACLNGSSELVNTISISIVNIFYNLQLMRFLGENGVSAYGVIMYVFMIFGAIFIGYSIGSSPLLSFQYGAKNRIEMRSILRKSLLFIGIAGVVMLIAAQLLAVPISYLFVGYDEELRQLTETGFRIYSLAFLIMGFSMYGSAFFTALNNGLVSALLAFLRALVFETGAVFLIPELFGVEAIWLSVSFAEVAGAIATAIFMIALGKRYGYIQKKAWR